MNAGLECNVGGAEIEAEKLLMGVNTATGRAAACIAPSSNHQIRRGVLGYDPKRACVSIPAFPYPIQP